MKYKNKLTDQMVHFTENFSSVLFLFMVQYLNYYIKSTIKFINYDNTKLNNNNIHTHARVEGNIQNRSRLPRYLFDRRRVSYS